MSQPDNTGQTATLWHYLMQSRSFMLFDTTTVASFPNKWAWAQKSLLMLFWAVPLFLILAYTQELFLSKLASVSQSQNGGETVKQQLQENVLYFEVYLQAIFAFLANTAVGLLVMYHVSHFLTVRVYFPRWMLVYNCIRIWSYLISIIGCLCLVFIPGIGMLIGGALMMTPLYYMYASFRKILMVEKGTAILLVFMHIVIDLVFAFSL